MSARASAGNLAQSVKDLSTQWQETKTHWTDTKSISFEKTYLEELPGVVARTGTVMEEIDELLRKVQADCE
jgi:hypothetical protein